MTGDKQYTIRELLQLYSQTKKTETVRKLNTSLNQFYSTDLKSFNTTIRAIELKRLDLLNNGIKGQTINTYCAVLSGFWNWAHSRGYLGKDQLNPYKALENLPDDEKKEIRDLTDSEVSRLLKVSEGLNHLRWALHIYTGLRWNNIHNLTWSQIDGDFIKLAASEMKSKRSLNIPICRKLKEILSYYRTLAERDRIFKRKSYPTILKYYREDCRKAGIKDPEELGLHSLRHTYATKLYHSGVPLLTISRLLDHSSVRVTEKYLHIQADEMTEAVANLSY